MTPEQAVVSVETVSAIIDGLEVTVPKGTLIIRAAEQLGIAIPRFCDHPLLAPAGACRQCLVDVEINGRAFPKPQASCTMPVENNMVVKTQNTSPVAAKAQEGIMEFLLINHPLDCPVCDKGGECPLQNQAMSAGRSETRFEGEKRTFEKPINISSQVLLDRERCVLCARCTRFSEEIAGDPFITLNERGALQQVGIYENQPFESYYSGNTVQICPVGALTGASYRFRARPFDLVSVNSACEHCASGCDLRTDIRRGKTLRRLAGDDPAVNQEWNCDKGRWAFKYLTTRERVKSPLVRGSDGELHEASWPEALAAATAGLKGKRVGVLTGGRLTHEDAYGYSKFARVALGTNDIDFRARPHSDEERDFLAAVVTDLKTSYLDIDKADHVVLLSFEPEEESPIVFLRVYRQVRKRGLLVTSDAPIASRGNQKLNAVLVKSAQDISGLTSQSVILVGERAAEVEGALSATLELAQSSGAKLAWIPRRAGERGALAAGALGNLLPGNRPVGDSAARVDLQSAWGVNSLPTTPGRSTAEILSALNDESLDAVVIGGVDPMDISVDALNKLLNTFVVSLEISHSAVTAIADVVLPVAAVVEKSGSYLDWRGSARSFDKGLEEAELRSDVRILSMLADEMGAPINLPTVSATAREIESLGSWDGAKPTMTKRAYVAPAADEMTLVSWRFLLDLGTLQLGEANLAGTAKEARAHISSATAATLGVTEADLVVISSDLGAIDLPVSIREIADNLVWVPRNSAGSQVIPSLGFASGAVKVAKAMTTTTLIGEDPGWLILVKGLFIFVFCVVCTLMAVWGERRIVARMQMRLGPNRVGKFGLLQSLADGVKLALKEDLIPAAADKIVFIIAPIISATTCFMAFAVIPFTGKVTLFGHKTAMQLTDLPVSVLYILAIASIGVYGIVLAGWSSGSTYPLLGGLRSSAQVISYEVAMGLSLVAVFIYSGSMSTSEIVAAQHQWWFAVVLFPSFVIYVISMVGETNRAPFDLAEAEGELVGGFHTEYSSLKFALFFLAEYVNIVAVSALATTLFMGGYHALPGLTFTESWLGGWFTLFWFVGKVVAFFFLFVWLRGTLPRLRYDQFMKFGWKVLIPTSLIWILVLATLRVMSQRAVSRLVVFGFSIGVVLLVVVVTTLYDRSVVKAKAAATLPDVPAPNFPVPALPGQNLLHGIALEITETADAIELENHNG